MTAVELQDPGAVEGTWKDWIRREPPRSDADVAAERKKPLALTEYQRTTLARTFDAYGDEMYRLIEERGESGNLTPERAVWMADQVDGWYELADAMRTKRPVR